MPSGPVNGAVRAVQPSTQASGMQLPDTASNCVEPDSALLAYGAHVKVLPPLDPHAGHVGVVRRVWLAGADLLHSVRFADGTRGDYYDNELQRLPEWRL